MDVLMKVAPLNVINVDLVLCYKEHNAKELSTVLILVGILVKNVEMDINYRIIYVKMYQPAVWKQMQKVEHVRNVNKDLNYLGINVLMLRLKLIDVISNQM